LFGHLKTSPSWGEVPFLCPKILTNQGLGLLQNAQVIKEAIRGLENSKIRSLLNWVWTDLFSLFLIEKSTRRPHQRYVLILAIVLMVIGIAAAGVGFWRTKRIES
jgi:hypothetical protein